MAHITFILCSSGWMNILKLCRRKKKIKMIMLEKISCLLWNLIVVCAEVVGFLFLVVFIVSLALLIYVIVMAVVDEVKKRFKK